MPTCPLVVPVALLNQIKTGLIRLGYANELTSLSAIQDLYFRYIVVKQATVASNYPNVPYGECFLPPELRDALNPSEPTEPGMYLATAQQHSDISAAIYTGTLPVYVDSTLDSSKVEYTRTSANALSLYFNDPTTYEIRDTTLALLNGKLAIVCYQLVGFTNEQIQQMIDGTMPTELGVKGAEQDPWTWLSYAAVGAEAPIVTFGGKHFLIFPISNYPISGQALFIGLGIDLDGTSGMDYETYSIAIGVTCTNTLNVINVPIVPTLASTQDLYYIHNALYNGSIYVEGATANELLSPQQATVENLGFNGLNIDIKVNYDPGLATYESPDLVNLSKSYPLAIQLVGMTLEQYNELKAGQSSLEFYGYNNTTQAWDLLPNSSIAPAIVQYEQGFYRVITASTINPAYTYSRIGIKDPGTGDINGLARIQATIGSKLYPSQIGNLHSAVNMVRSINSSGDAFNASYQDIVHQNAYNLPIADGGSYIVKRGSVVVWNIIDDYRYDWAIKLSDWNTVLSNPPSPAEMTYYIHFFSDNLGSISPTTANPLQLDPALAPVPTIGFELKYVSGGWSLKSFDGVTYPLPNNAISNLNTILKVEFDVGNNAINLAAIVNNTLLSYVETVKLSKSLNGTGVNPANLKLALYTVFTNDPGNNTSTPIYFPVTRDARKGWVIGFGDAASYVESETTVHTKGATWSGSPYANPTVALARYHEDGNGQDAQLVFDLIGNNFWSADQVRLQVKPVIMGTNDYGSLHDQLRDVNPIIMVKNGQGNGDYGTGNEFQVDGARLHWTEGTLSGLTMFAFTRIGEYEYNFQYKMDGIWNNMIINLGTSGYVNPHLYNGFGVVIEFLGGTIEKDFTFAQQLAVT